MWARSLAIIAIREGYDAAQHDGVVVLEAAAACAVLASVLGMHMWVQPYQYRYQNRLEVALSTTNLVFVALLCVLNTGGCEGDGMGDSLARALEVTAVVVVFSPAAFGLLWLAASGGRRAVTIARLRELMVTGGGEEDPNRGLMLVDRHELAVVGQEAADERERLELEEERAQFRERLSSLSEQSSAIVGRFAESELRVLTFGKPEFSTLPIAFSMGADDNYVVREASADDGGVGAIAREVGEHGTADDRMLLEYVLRGRTGAPEAVGCRREWPNGTIDEGQPAGLSLDDFGAMEQARAARLSVGMVLALRLYSTAVYMSINAPLREGTEHPMPVLVHVLTEAIKRLRTVEGRDATQNEPLTLWRGMRNVAELPQRFLDEGGTERAPMSTTRELAVAVRYSMSARATLLKLRTSDFRSRGVDLRFVSAFPGEAEVLYPPLTHLRPVRRADGEAEVHEHVMDDGRVFAVVEVVPSFG